MNRFRRSAVLATILVLLPVAPSQALVLVDVDAILSSLDLSGTGAVALGPGRTDVDTLLEVGLSGAGTSAVNVLLEVDDSLSTFTLAVTGTLFLDMTFTDDDPGADFAAGVGAGGELFLEGTTPLVTSITASYTLLQLLALAPYLEDDPEPTLDEAISAYNADNPGSEITATISDPGLKFGLGVDLDGNMIEDAILVTASAFLWDLALDTPIDIDPVTGAVTFAVTDVTFTGGVFDVTDPPFSIPLSGDIGGAIASSVPEPHTAALLLVALAAAWRRRAPG